MTLSGTTRGSAQTVNQQNHHRDEAHTMDRLSFHKYQNRNAFVSMEKNLIRCACKGDLRGVQFFYTALREGATTEECKKSLREVAGKALLKASGNRILEVVQWLVESAGVSVDYEIQGMTALTLAVRDVDPRCRSKVQIAKYLIRNGANPNQYCLGVNTLITTVKNDCLFHAFELTKCLINDGGVHVDATEKATGNTALHYASAIPGKFPLVPLLHQAGANINIRNEMGSTVLHVACAAPSSAENEELVWYLLSRAEADILPRDVWGETCMEKAMENHDNPKLISLFQTRRRILQENWNLLQHLGSIGWWSRGSLPSTGRKQKRRIPSNENP